LDKYFNAQYTNPQQIEQLNPVFKKYTGHDIQSADDVVKAMAYQRHGNTQTKVSEEKLVDNYSASKSLQDQRQAAENARLKQRLAAKHGDSKAQDEILDGVINRLKNSSANQGVNYTSTDNTKEKQYIIPQPTNDMLELLKNGKNNPNQIRFSEDGKSIIGIFYKGSQKLNKATGKYEFQLDTPTQDGKIAVDKSLTTKIPVQEFKLLYGKKLLGQKNAVAETADDNDGNDNESAGDNDASTDNEYNQYKRH
jgi:hypothetical protein